jgi:hypothetical protein
MLLLCGKRGSLTGDTNDVQLLFKTKQNKTKKSMCLTESRIERMVMIKKEAGQRLPTGSASPHHRDECAAGMAKGRSRVVEHDNHHVSDIPHQPGRLELVLPQKIILRPWHLVWERQLITISVSPHLFEQEGN